MTGSPRAGLLSAVALCAAVATPTAAAAEGYTIVVPTEHLGGAISRKDLADVFLKRATRWGSGDPIHVVDQSLRSDVRVSFTHDVLEMSSLAVMTYWQQQLSRGGQRPPQVKGSDTEVLEFIAKTPGSIGYVSPETPSMEGVKALQVVE